MKILGIGKNFVLDTSEIEAIKDGVQVIFSKPESSLVRDNKNVAYPAGINDVRYEVELVIKIGKTGKNINETEASSYISEIGLGIDFTAKDILDIYRAKKAPWDLAKGFDGAAPISSFQPIANFENTKNIKFDLSINGTLKQDGCTDLMIYNFEEIIAYISKFMTLEPGDLIFTGTPAAGVGQIFKGDHLIGKLEGETLIDFKMI